MTRRQSTKTLRLIALTVVLLGTIAFLVFSDATKHYDLVGMNDGDLNKEYSGQKSSTKGLGGTGKTSKESLGSKSKPKEDSKKPAKDSKTTPKKGKSDTKKTKPSQKPESGSKPKVSTKPKDKTGTIADSKDKPKSKPKVKQQTDQESVEGPQPEPKKGTSKSKPQDLSHIDKTAHKPYKNPVTDKFNAMAYFADDEEKPDPNNPNNFLGDMKELDPEDERLQEINGENEEEPETLEGAPGPYGFDLPEELYTLDANEYPVPPEVTDITPLKFRIYSHNIKNAGHQNLISGEEPWRKRLGKLVSSIVEHSTLNTVVALQEVYKFQLDDIMRALNRFSPDDEPEWLYYGVGRMDGRTIGEFVPILYKNEEWDLVYSDSFWLNERNIRASFTGWDALYLRIASFVTLRHKETDNYINIFNSHFDHKGEVSRIGSVKAILDKMKEVNEWPSFLAGDLNMGTNEKAYKLLLESMKDSSSLTTQFNRYGHTGSTVTGFEGEVLVNGGQKIDYIFVPEATFKMSTEVTCEKATGPYYLKLRGFGLMHSKFDGTYMSDHRPLVSDLTLLPSPC